MMPERRIQVTRSKSEPRSKSRLIEYINIDTLIPKNEVYCYDFIGKRPNFGGVPLDETNFQATNINKKCIKLSENKSAEDIKMNTHILPLKNIDPVFIIKRDPKKLIKNIWSRQELAKLIVVTKKHNLAKKLL